MYKRYMFAMTVGVIALLLGFTARQSVNASQSPAIDRDQERPLATRGFERWKYDATQLGPETYIRISSQINSKAALSALLAEHRLQQTRLFQSVRQGSLQQIPVTILMQKPIKIESFVDLVKKNDIQVQSYTLIAQDGSGELITFFGAPVDGDLFPEYILQAMVGNIEQSQNKKISVKGVVSIDAKVDVSMLTKLNSDPRILGVDITPALALQDLVQQIPEVDIARIHITSAPFYWETVRQ